MSAIVSGPVTYLAPKLRLWVHCLVGPLTELLKNQIAPVVSRKLDSIEIIRAFDINLDSCTFPLNM